ncbi:MAG: alpha-1,2-fucosyltransferase [Muribaculaceae bacterium]|nr:alpha-1,2-fucosyltransferase [Muribaculaceae bacterium]
MRDNFIRKVLTTIASPVAKLLHSTGLLTPGIIIKVDGGISSQMHHYIAGEILRENSDPNLVYDLVWFKECGKDIDGIQVRNFDLLNLFPDLKVPTRINPLKLRLYRLLYTYTPDWQNSKFSWKKLQPPLYISGYLPGDKDFFHDMSRIFKCNPVNLSDCDLHLADLIENEEQSVGIHVRRGDLTRYLPSYGAPASKEYFIRAIEFLREKYSGENLKFFIFSDEPDWVKEELLPALPQGEYLVQDQNDASKGYVDLWLLSRCKHKISSAGSFGKYAYLLNRADGCLIIPDCKESHHWKEKIPEAIMIPN